MDNKIFNGKNILALSVLAATSVNVMAVETVTSTATVTVQNSFTFTETTPINFGTLRAVPVATAASGSDTGAAGDVASLVLSSVDGSAAITAGATAKLQTLVAGANGVYTISGVSPYSALTLTLPTAVAATAIKLDVALPAPGAAYFWMYDFVATVTSGTAIGTTYAVANLTADASGDASFTLGATLATSNPAGTAAQSGYQEGDYTGNYTMTVDY